MIDLRSRRYHRRPWLIASAAVIIVAAVIVAPHAQAQALSAIATSIFRDVLNPIVIAMIQLFGKLTAYIVGLLVLVAQYPNFINSAPVVTGYPIVRDLSNMVFIIALLIIAAGTVLRIENYRYNRLLGRLVLMALLVNMARLITGFFIQTSQVFMLTFVNAFKDIALGNFGYMFGLDAVLKLPQTFNSLGNERTVFITLVGGLAMMIVAFCVMVALTIILVVRIVALWILTILSPLAYALRIIPNTDKYASQWWAQFGRYLVTGPVLAFFIWLALVISQSTCAAGVANCTTADVGSLLQSRSGQFKEVTDKFGQEVQATTQGLDSEIFTPARFLTFIVSIVFLVMGMTIAGGSGTIGAKFAQQTYQRGLALGATATGLNAIRDRTIAPIQGYLQQRDQRRRAGVAERSVALGARVDQALSGTVGRLGRAPAAASGALSRAVSGVGRVATGQETVREAAQATLAAGRAGLATRTRGYQQAQQRIEDWKQKKISVRGQELDVTSPRVQVADLKTLANGADGAVAAAAVAELVRRNELNHKNEQDVQYLQRTAGYLGDRQAGTKFMGAVEAVDPELARKAYFGDIADAATQSKIQQAIQARSVSTKILDRDDLEYITSNPTVAGQFANHIVNTARSLEEMKKFVAGINEDHRNDLFKHLDLTGKSYEDRKIVAEATGQVGRAFRDVGMFGPVQVANLRKFVQNRGKKLSDIIATASAEDSQMIAALQETPEARLSEKELGEIAEKSNFHRKALSKGLEGVYSTQIAASETYDRANPDFDVQETTRRAIFKVTQGETLKHNIGKADANEAFTRMAKGLQAGDLRQLMKNSAFDSAKLALLSPAAQAAAAAVRKTVYQIIGLKMSVRQIGEMAGQGSDQFVVAHEAVKEAHTKGKEASATAAELGRAKKLETDENTSDLIT